MRQVYLNDKAYTMPETWNELSGPQLKGIAPLLMQKQLSNADRWYICWQLCGFGACMFNRFANHLKGGYDYLAAQFTEELFPLIEWLFKKNELTRNLIPVIEVGGKFSFFGTTKLHGPADDFNNLTIEEFSDCESCLDQWNATGDELWLNRFIGILYRPKQKGINPAAINFKGDMRQPYNFHLNDFIAAMVSKTDGRIKTAVLLWYMGCRNNLAQCFPAVFTSAKDNKAHSGSNWTEVIHALAGPKFGTIEQTGRIPLKIVFTELTAMQKQAAQIQ